MNYELKRRLPFGGRFLIENILKSIDIRTRIWYYILVRR